MEYQKQRGVCITLLIQRNMVLRIFSDQKKSSMTLVAPEAQTLNFAHLALLEGKAYLSPGSVTIQSLPRVEHLRKCVGALVFNAKPSAN